MFELRLRDGVPGVYQSELSCKMRKYSYRSLEVLISFRIVMPHRSALAPAHDGIDQKALCQSIFLQLWHNAFFLAAILAYARIIAAW